MKALCDSHEFRVWKSGATLRKYRDAFRLHSPPPKALTLADSQP
jgi:hypothetical protein